MPRPCRSLPCHSFIHTSHVAPCPAPDSAMSFVKVRAVAGIIRTAGPKVQQTVFFCSLLLPLFTVVGMDRCEEDWYASGNNLHGTPHVAGRNRTRAGSPLAVSRRPCCAVVLRRTAWSKQDMDAEWQV
jgi:hypothetical protein